MGRSKAEERRSETVTHDCEKLMTRKMGFIREFIAKQFGSSDISQNLDDDRIAAILSTFKTPTHPPYALMITRAIEGLNEERGSSRETISEFITNTFENLPLAHDAILEYHLNVLREKGEIICRDNELYTTAANGTGENDSVVTKQKKRKRAREKGIGNVKRTKVNSKARKEPNVESVEVINERRSTRSNNGAVSREERVLSLEQVPKLKKPRLTLQEKHGQCELQRRKLRSHARLGVEPETAIIISEPLMFSEATNHQPETTKDQHQDEPPLKQCRWVGPAVPAMQRVLRSNSRAATSETAIVVYEPAPVLPPLPLLEKRDGRGRPRKRKMTEEKPNMKAVVLWDPREGEGEEKKKRGGRGRGRPRKLKTTATEVRPNALRAPQTEAGKKCDGRGRPRKLKTTTTTEDKPNPVGSLRAPLEAAENEKKNKKKHDGRGRPRKFNTTTITTKTEDNTNTRGVSLWATQEGAEKKKRDGRGRPKKLNTTTAPTTTTTTTTKEKPNSKAVSPDAPLEEAEKKKPRDGRGRPRKTEAITTTKEKPIPRAELATVRREVEENNNNSKKQDSRGRPRNVTPPTETAAKPAVAVGTELALFKPRGEIMDRSPTSGGGGVMTRARLKLAGNS